MILSVYYFVNLIISPVIGAFLYKIGRKNAIVISYVLAATAAMGYAMLAMIKDT